MKAAVLTTPAPIFQSPLKIEDIPTPEPKPGHVLLKVLACGVCRTDLHIVEGELPPRNPRIVPGHQIVGEVVAGDLDAAPLLCAGIIGFRALRVAGVQKGDRVGLFGFGASAHLAIKVLQSWNCEVYVSTRGESHRKLAESLGAKWVGTEKEKPPVELDRAVTFAPSGDVVVTALSSLRKGGVVAINAIHLDRIPQFDYDRLLWGERQIRSVANMTRADARDFLALAAGIDLRPAVTTFPLEHANEALAAIKSGAVAGAAVILP